MCFLYVSGICVFLVKHNTTKACAISLNYKSKVAHKVVHNEATYKDNVARKYTRTNNLQGYSTLSPRPNGVGLYPGLSAISQAALSKGLKGFITHTPNVNLCLGISMSKIFAYPTAFYLKSEWDSD